MNIVSSKVVSQQEPELKPPAFPCVLEWKGFYENPGEKEKRQIIVMFLNVDEGIALVHEGTPFVVGRKRPYTPATNRFWEPFVGEINLKIG